MILCINTAGYENTLALVKDEVLIAEKTWQSERNETETLLSYLQELLKNQHLGFDDIKTLHVIQGVGGFTSLRVGMSIVNTIAYVQKIPIYGSSVFELWSKRLKNKKNVAILIDAGRQELFYLSFLHTATQTERFQSFEGKKLSQTKKNIPYFSPHIIPNTELAELKEEFWIGEINEKQKEMLSQITELTDLKSPGEAFTKIDLSNKKPYQLIEPWYGREPNISKAKKMF